MPRLASDRPRLYEDRQHPGIHKGEIDVIGTKTIDLGIGHTNFVLTTGFPEVAGQDENGQMVRYEKLTGRQAGQVKFTVYDHDNAGGDWDVSIATTKVSFIAIAGASVE
jgi:hypothetical protein